MHRGSSNRWRGKGWGPGWGRGAGLGAGLGWGGGARGPGKGRAAPPACGRRCGRREGSRRRGGGQKAGRLAGGLGEGGRVRLGSGSAEDKQLASVRVWPPPRCPHAPTRARDAHFLSRATSSPGTLEITVRRVLRSSLVICWGVGGSAQGSELILFLYKDWTRRCLSREEVPSRDTSASDVLCVRGSISEPRQ